MSKYIRNGQEIHRLEFYEELKKECTIEGQFIEEDYISLRKDLNKGKLVHANDNLYRIEDQ